MKSNQVLGCPSSSSQLLKEPECDGMMLKAVAN